MRSRNLKPGIFGHTVLRSMPPANRLLLLGLTTLADCRGLVEDRPRMIKNMILPDDEVDVNAALDDLATVTDDDGSTLIQRYVGTNGVRAIKINTFRKHNRPNIREPENEKLCEPDGEHGTGTVPVLNRHGASPVPARCESALTSDFRLLTTDFRLPTSEPGAGARFEVESDPEAPEAAAADPIQAAVVEIVAHLNGLTGRRFDPAGAHTELRRALKRDGLTPVEARGILDHLWSEWGADPKMARCVDTVTPFRKSNLPRYRDAIAAGPVGASRSEIPIESEPWR